MGIRIKLPCHACWLKIYSLRELLQLCLLNNSMGASISAKVNPQYYIVRVCVLPFIIIYFQIKLIRPQQCSAGQIKSTCLDVVFVLAFISQWKKQGVHELKSRRIYLSWTVSVRVLFLSHSPTACVWSIIAVFCVSALSLCRPMRAQIY
jgi:hypothetical protein